MANNSKTYFVYNERYILISYNYPIIYKLISNLSNTRKTIETHNKTSLSWQCRDKTAL